MSSSAGPGGWSAAPTTIASDIGLPDAGSPADEVTNSEMSTGKLITLSAVMAAFVSLVMWLFMQHGWVAAAVPTVVALLIWSVRSRLLKKNIVVHESSPTIEAEQHLLDNPDELSIEPKLTNQSMLDRWKLKRQAWWDDRPAFVQDGKPKSGPRLVLWYFWVRLRLYKLSFIPQPRPWGVWRYRNDELQSAINTLRDDVRGIVLVFITKGGAMKTTITTWVASALKKASHAEVFGFDADTGGGKLARRYTFGGRKVIDVVKLINRLQLGPISNRDLLDQGCTDEHSGVIISYCPPLEKDDEGNHIPGPNVSQTSTALENLLEAVSVVFVDGGPGLSNSMIDGAFRVGDVFIQPARYGVDEHYEDIHKVIDTYGLEGKIDDVILVFGAVPWRSFNTRAIHELAQEFGVMPQQIVLLPYNSYMEKLRKVDLKRVPQKVLWSIYTITLLVAQRLAVELPEEKNAKVTDS